MKPQFLVALVATAIAVVAVLVLSLGSKDGDNASETTTTLATTSTSSTVPEQDTTTTTIEIPPDWYPKGSSRYSDREPNTTVTALPRVEDPDDSGPLDSDSDEPDRVGSDGRVSEPTGSR